MKSISRETLAARLDAGADIAVVEALPERYYRSGHLPNARHLPHDAVETLAPGVLPDPAQEIIVYCANRACRNSSAAAQALARLGYSNVAVYEGGKEDWVGAGLALETIP